MIVTAKFDGDCSECEQSIKVGQDIAETRYTWGPGWHHVVCPPPHEVCRVCFMEKSINGLCLCSDVGPK